jgi:hypothetical protein
MPTYVSLAGWETGVLSAEDINTTGAMSVQSSIKRSGQYALRCNPTSSVAARTTIVAHNSDAVGSVWSQPTFSLNPCWLRAWVYLAAVPASGSEEFIFASSHAFLRITSARKIDLYDSNGTTLRASGTIALALNEWSCIQAKIGVGTSSAPYEVKINGVVDYSGSNGAFSASNVSSLSTGNFAIRSSQGYDIYFDDFAVCSDDYPPMNGKIVRLDPSVAGTETAWTGTNTDVDDLASQANHDSDTSFINTSTNANAESAHCVDAASAGITGIVHCVKPVVVVRDLGNTTNIKYGLRTPAGVHTSTNTEDAALSYTWRQRVFSIDPVDAAAWTLAKVDGLEPRVIHNQAQSRELRCTVMCVMVEYEPPVEASLHLGAGVLGIESGGDLNLAQLAIGVF